MIIATSQVYALAAGGCCPCLPPEAPEPRRDCQSLSIFLGSAGYFKPEGDTVWTSYQTLTYAVSHSASGSDGGAETTPGCVFSYSYSGSWEWTNVYSTNGNVEWSGPCFEGGLHPQVLTDCTDALTESISEQRTCTDSSGEVYLSDASTYSRTRARITGQPNPEHAEWEVAAAEWDAADPDERDPDRPSEPSELYPDCTFQDSVTITSQDIDGNVEGFPVTYDPGGLAGLSPPYYVSNNEYAFTETYSGGYGYAEWVDAARGLAEDKANFAEELDAACFGGGCVSSMTVTPEPVAPAPEEPEEGGPAPPAPTAPKRRLQMAVTKARYRIGIPTEATWKATTAEWIAWDEDEPETRGPEPEKTSYDVAHAAWVIAHAAWTALPIAERGPEPVEPIPRTYYAWQGDEVFFPTAWTAWKSLKDAFDAATDEHELWETYPARKAAYDEALAAYEIWLEWLQLKSDYDFAVGEHAAWEAMDPDDRGDEPFIPPDPGEGGDDPSGGFPEDPGDEMPPEPEIPADPGAAPTPGPTLVSSRSWTYGGTAEWSGWFEIAIPTTPGETRLVNQMARHYRSARLGNKPAAFGEVYEL